MKNLKDSPARAAKKLTRHIMVRMTEDMYEQVQEVAYNTGFAASTLCRNWFLERLKEVKK